MASFHTCFRVQTSIQYDFYHIDGILVQELRCATQVQNISLGSSIGGNMGPCGNSCTMSTHLSQVSLADTLSYSDASASLLYFWWMNSYIVTPCADPNYEKKNPGSCPICCLWKRTRQLSDLLSMEAYWCHGVQKITVPEDLITAPEHLPTAPEHLLTAPEHFRNCSGALS